MGRMKRYGFWRREWIDLGLDPERCTCLNCSNSDQCHCAYDIFNVDEDCLMMVEKSQKNRNNVVMFY
jgi:hypothetical protein